jgi:hypothetical protein
MMPDVNEDFLRISKEEGWYSEALIERIAKTGHVSHPEVPERWQRVFVTANQIAPEWHIRMQAAFQQHCAVLFRHKADCTVQQLEEGLRTSAPSLAFLPAELELLLQEMQHLKNYLVL